MKANEMKLLLEVFVALLFFGICLPGCVQSAVIKRCPEFEIDNVDSSACQASLEAMRDGLTGKSLDNTAISDCCDIFILGERTGIYWLYEVDEERVLCDMQSAGGGWIVFGKRFRISNNEFFRTWSEYVNGFGVLAQEFWLGLDNLHRLTSSPEGAQLRIELNGGTHWVQFDNFTVDGPETNYALHISDFSGNLFNFDLHNGAPFSTKDHNSGPTICPTLGKVGWWYRNEYPCYTFNPFSKIIDWPVNEGYQEFSSAEIKLRIKRYPCP